MRLKFPCLKAAFLVTAALLMTISNALAADERPNFLLIIADDLCWRDLGYEGNKVVQTPHLDRLRSQGMHLTNMYTPAPTCSPTRHALFTGLFPIRSGAYPNHTHLNDGIHSMFGYLKDDGYRVALHGKTHVGPRQSFPYDYLTDKNDPDLVSVKEYISQNNEKPWLMVVASHEPHSPWNKGDKSLYPPDQIEIPSYLHDTKITRNQFAAYYREITYLDSKVGLLMDYLDETKQADDTLVIFVSEQGSSFPYGGKWSLYDNGIHASSIARWPGKIKAGSKSDALIQYVDIPATFLSLAGLDPTNIDTGSKDGNGSTVMDGKSFADVLTGKADHFRDYVFAQHTTVGINGYLEAFPMRAVRDKRFKLIRNLAPENTFSIGGIHRGPLIESWKVAAKADTKLAEKIDFLFHRPAVELYDVANDPLEEHNLAGDPRFSQDQSRLSAKLDEWMAQQNDRGMETEMEAPKHQAKEREAEEETSDPTPAPRKGKGKARQRN